MSGEQDSAAKTAGRVLQGSVRRADKIFWVCAAFLLGILAASLDFSFYRLAAGIIFVAVALLFLKTELFRKIILAAVIFVFAGFFYYHFYLNFKISSQNMVFGESQDFAGTVVSESKKAEQIQTFFVDVAEPWHGRVKIVSRQFPEIKYGDAINFRGAVRRADSAKDAPVSVFPEISGIESGHGFWLKEYLLAFKYKLISGFQKVLPPDSAALLAGITFGYRGDFTKEFKEQMAQSGTTHLVAISGYNIGVLVLAMASLFGRFLSSRRTFYFTGVAILFFVLMVGGEASVVRAAIMGFLALLAKESSRLYDMRNGLALTATAMVALNPTILVFDLGFQLSFLSLIGIVYFSPAVQFLFGARPVGALGGGIRESFFTTLSAQTAVLPLLLAKFGTFSLAAIAANVLILELIPLTMFLGFLLAGVNLVLPFFGSILGWFAGFVLSYEIGIIKIFARVRLPVAAPSSWFVFAVIYGGIVLGIMAHYWRKRKGKINSRGLRM